MRILETADLRPNTPLTRNERDWLYNGLDVGVTLEVRDAMIPFLDNIASSTYQFSLDLQAPILEMSMRGLKVNQKRRFEVLRIIRAKIAILNDQLTQIVRDGIGMPVENVAAKGKNKEKMWWRSPVQLKILLYDVMGLPIQKKRNAKGLMAPSTDRTSLEKLDAYFIAEPVVAHLLALRDLDKKRGWLETEIDSDGRMRSNFNIAGTNTGRLASSLSDFGTGGNLQNIDRDLRSVFIADPGMKFGNLDLEQADSRNLGALCWERFRESHGEKFAGAYLDLCECLTPDHDVLTPFGWTSIKNKPAIIMCWDKGILTFEDIQKWNEGKSSRMIGVESRTLSILGTVNHMMPVYAGENKQLAKKSLLAIKGKSNYVAPITGKYKTGKRTEPNAALLAAFQADGTKDKANRIHFTFQKERKIKLFRSLIVASGIKYSEYLLGTGTTRFYVHANQGLTWKKTCGPEILDWDFNTLTSFCNSHRQWDGHIERTGSTRIVALNKEHLEWLAVANTLIGKVTSISKHKQNYWILTIKERTTTQYRSAKISTLDGNFDVYCPTVSTGFFLVRRNDKIYISGNSGDLHTQVSQIARPHLPWTDDPKLNRQIADTPYYRNYTYRDLDKRLSHGTNYLGAPRTMAKHSKVPVKEVEEFQRNYFRNLPCIPEYHKYVRREIEDSASLITLFGRRRFFFGRPKDDATIREAVAFCPQSMTAEEINIGMLHVWRAKKVQLLVQVHDSILFQYPEELEDEIIPWALKTLRIPLTLTHDREFVVPTEAKVGYNWGEFDKDKNPDGLVKWKGIGSDGRKRTDLNWALKLGD